MPKSRKWGQGRPCLLLGGGPGVGALVAAALADAGFVPEAVESEGQAIAALDRRPFAAAFIGQKVGAAAVQAVIARAAQSHPEVPVLILASTGTLQDAVDAMQQGAADYLAPPFQPDVFLARLRKLVERGAIAELPAPSPPGPELPGLIGASPAMRKVYSTIERISRYKTNVLLLGESGTGKELVARALHTRGPRRKHLFVPLNCATLGREILENELFGHERGAFTGANERKKGLFELADGGTLFLDEIAEMDPSTQAKLLRVLERNEFRRVGGTDKVKVDLSVIAATNRNLEDAIKANRFREDLYYRLKVVTIVVPALRERKEDIPALIDTFIADFNRRNAGKIRGIAPQTLKELMQHDWPGNVRELKNAVESAAVLATGETIDPDTIADVLMVVRKPPVTAGRPQRTAASRSEGRGNAISVPPTATLAEAERSIILDHVRRAGTKSAAARSLGIGLRTLYTKLREYGTVENA